MDSSDQTPFVVNMFSRAEDHPKLDAYLTSISPFGSSESRHSFQKDHEMFEFVLDECILMMNRNSHPTFNSLLAESIRDAVAVDIKLINNPFYVIDVVVGTSTNGKKICKLIKLLNMPERPKRVRRLNDRIDYDVSNGDIGACSITGF